MFFHDSMLSESRNSRTSSRGAAPASYDWSPTHTRSMQWQISASSALSASAALVTAGAAQASAVGHRSWIFAPSPASMTDGAPSGNTPFTCSRSISTSYSLPSSTSRYEITSRDPMLADRNFTKTYSRSKDATVSTSSGSRTQFVMTWRTASTHANGSSASLAWRSSFSSRRVMGRNDTGFFVDGMTIDR